MEKIYKKTLQILKRAGKLYHKKEFVETAENKKYDNDIVTDKDVLVQKYLVKNLSKLIKGCGFIGEEKLNDSKNKEYVWIMDPIDGTHNYSKNIYCYGTQVALQKNGRTIFSAMYLPTLKEMLYTDNGKSYCNGKQIFSSENETAKSIVLNIWLPGKEEAPITMETLTSYIKSRKLRIFGSSLYDFALVASGKCDGLLINASTAWDIEPGLLIATNAGCKVFHIKEYHLMIVAGNNKLLNDIEKNLRLISNKNIK